MTTSQVTVRSPTGKEKDLSVTCNADWTVKDLKFYLSETCQSNPPVNTQKLVYQGKLLADNALISDVLQTASGASSGSGEAPVFFFICSAAASAPSSPAPAVALDRAVSCPAKPASSQDPLAAAAAAAASTSRSPATPATAAAATPPTPIVSTPVQETELRHRVPVAESSGGASTEQSSTQPIQVAPSAPTPTPSIDSSAGPAAATNPYHYWSSSSWPAGSTPYQQQPWSPEQQQAYAAAYYHQYSSYMSQPTWQVYMASAAAAAAHASLTYQTSGNAYYSGSAPHAAFSPAAQAAGIPAAAAAAAGQPMHGNPAAGAAPAAAPVPNQQQPAMPAAPGANAGGLLGAVDNDDDDDGQQPRLFRNVANGIRIAVMLCVLYSICTPFRFTLLVITTIVINLYQAGFFNLRRAAQRRHNLDDRQVRELLAAARRNAEEHLQRQRNRAARAAADGPNGTESSDSESGESSDEDGSGGSSSMDGEGEKTSDPVAQAPPRPSTTRVILHAARAFVTSLFLDPEVAAN